MAIVGGLAVVMAGSMAYQGYAQNKASSDAQANLDKTLAARPPTPAASEASAQQQAASAKANNLRTMAGFGGSGSTILTGGMPGLGNPQTGGKTLLGA